MHARNLRLLEVGRDPDVIGLGQREELLAGRNLRGHLHLLVADDAVLGRVDAGVLEVQLRLVGLRLGDQLGGLALRQHLALLLDLPRRHGFGLPGLRFGLAELRLRLRHGSCSCLGRLPPAGDHCGLRLGIGGLLIVLLARHLLLDDQQTIALFLACGVGLIGLGLLEVGDRRAIALLARRDVCLRAHDIELGLSDLRTLIYRGNRHVRGLGPHAGLRLGIVGAGLLLGHLVVAPIELDQQLPLAHHICIFHVHRFHDAADAEADRVRVAVDKGIVRTHKAAQVVEQQHAADDEQNRSRNDPGRRKGMLMNPSLGLLLVLGQALLERRLLLFLVVPAFLIVSTFFVAVVVAALVLLAGLLLLLTHLVELPAQASLLVVEHAQRKVVLHLGRRSNVVAGRRSMLRLRDGGEAVIGRKG